MKLPNYDVMLQLKIKLYCSLGEYPQATMEDEQYKAIK